MAASVPNSKAPPIQRVSTIELFFDLVFVFAVTQLTGLVAHPHHGLDYVKTGLVFVTLMWMYDGFAWLTSNIRVESNRDCWWLTGAMAAFLVMSLSIPTVFESGGLTYGIGLVVATLVHAGMFRSAPNSSARAILAIVPYNLGAALLVLGAAWVEVPWKWALWAGAVALPILSTLFRRESQFAVSPEHFVERHGLLIIVALGESIVGVGQGAHGLPLSLGLLGFAALGLYLGVCIWGSYFDEDDRMAEHALVRAAPERRARMALLGFGYGHMAMIAGIILVAAGLEVGIHHPLERSGAWAAGNLAAGLAIYGFGDVIYRRVMGIGPNRLRIGVAALSLPTVFLGLWVCPLVQLAAGSLLFSVIWATEPP